MIRGFVGRWGFQIQHEIQSVRAGQDESLALTGTLLWQSNDCYAAQLVKLDRDSGERSLPNLAVLLILQVRDRRFQRVLAEDGADRPIDEIDVIVEAAMRALLGLRTLGEDELFQGDLVHR